MNARCAKRAGFGYFTTAVAMTLAAPAEAQVNCNMWHNAQQRAACYGQQAQIYRQQSEQYNSIARQQWQQHQNVGRALRYAPLIGPQAQRAWNAPRYIYQFRYGRP